MAGKSPKGAWQELLRPLVAAQNGFARLLESGLAKARRNRAVDLVVDVVDGTIGDFFRHDDHVYSAAVAFYGAISLFPFMLLMVALGGFLVAGLSDGQTTETGVLFGDLLQFLRAAVPYLGEDLEANLVELVNRRASFGLAGAVALLLLSSLVFRSLEFALARVFTWKDILANQERPRNLVISKLLFGAFAMAMVTTFMGIRYLLGALRGLAAGVDPALFELLGQTFLGEGSVIRILLWDAVVVLSFMVVLAFFSRRRARPRAIYSMLGGCLFLALWSAAGWAFDLYVGRFASLPATYGPWAALIVIQLWIYYSAVVFMVACEFVKTLQRRWLQSRRG